MSTESVVRVIAAGPVRHARGTRLVRATVFVRQSFPGQIPTTSVAKKLRHHADKLESVMDNGHARFIHQLPFAELRFARMIHVMR